MAKSLPAKDQRRRVKPYIIHVDAMVMKANRELSKRDPIVRIIDPATGKKYYSDWVLIDGASWLDTQWDNPLPDRPSAVCVLRTYARVLYGNGSIQQYTEAPEPKR